MHDFSPSPAAATIVNDPGTGTPCMRQSDGLWTGRRQLQPPAADTFAASQTLCWIYSDPACLPIHLACKAATSLISQLSDDNRVEEAKGRGREEKQRFRRNFEKVFPKVQTAWSSEFGEIEQMVRNASNLGSL